MKFVGCDVGSCVGTTGAVDGEFVAVHWQYFCSAQAIGHPSPLHSNQSLHPALPFPWHAVAIQFAAGTGGP